VDSGGKVEVLRRINATGVRPLASSRLPVTTSVRPHAEVVEQFAEYAEEYKANVTRILFADLADVVFHILSSAGHLRVVTPPDLPGEWIKEGLDLQRDSLFDHRALSDMQAVVTGCAVAVAETGTIVLDAGFAQGRRAITLVPDHHVCVVFEDQVVDSVPEAVAAVGESVRKGQPLTWISGPSATSDIELSRVEGVHGPRTLDIVLVRR